MGLSDLPAETCQLYYHVWTFLHTCFPEPPPDEPSEPAAPDAKMVAVRLLLLLLVQLRWSRCLSSVHRLHLSVLISGTLALLGSLPEVLAEAAGKEGQVAGLAEHPACLMLANCMLQLLLLSNRAL